MGNALLFLVFFTIIGTVVSQKIGWEDCTEREVLNNCSSACIPERSCNNRYPTSGSDACAAVCVPRCECDANRDFIRNDDTGRCVTLDRCPGNCSSSEIFKPCASPCVPERTCQYQYPIEPVVCVKSCRLRCECDGMKGLIRDKPGGKCVDIGDCRDKCGPNQVYGCGSCCPELTCTNPQRQTCNIKCLVCLEQCLCRPGYVRDTFNGRCVLLKDCPRNVAV